MYRRKAARRGRVSVLEAQLGGSKAIRRRAARSTRRRLAPLRKLARRRVW